MSDKNTNEENNITIKNYFINLVKGKQIFTFLMTSIIAAAAIGCLIKIAPGTDISNAQRPQNNIPSTRKIWADAVQEAENREPEAILRSVKIKARDILVSGDNPTIIFTFWVNQPSYKTIAVEWNGKIFDISSYQLEKSHPECLPLELDSFRVSGQKAFNVAVRNGGDKFLRQDDPFVQLTLISHCDYSRPVWRVHFSNYQSLESLTITIDGQTGDVIDVW